MPSLCSPRVLAVAIAACCLPGLTGCFKVTTVLQVNPDGSGKLVETLAMSQQTAQQIESMITGFAQGGDALPTGGLLSEGTFKGKEASYGPGVKLVSFNKSQEAERVQASAEYTVADVTKLKLSASSQPAVPGQAARAKQEAPFRFSLRKLPDGLSELTIDLPQSEAPPAEPNQAKEGEQPATGQEIPAAMLEMFRDLEMTVALDCGREITETNATHVEGNRLTLVHFAFAKLMDHPEKLQALRNLGPQARDLTALRPLIKDVEGLKFESEPRVVVKFR